MSGKRRFLSRKESRVLEAWMEGNRGDCANMMLKEIHKKAAAETGIGGLTPKNVETVVIDLGVVHATRYKNGAGEQRPKREESGRGRRVFAQALLSIMRGIDDKLDPETQAELCEIIES